MASRKRLARPTAAYTEPEGGLFEPSGKLSRRFVRHGESELLEGSTNSFQFLGPHPDDDVEILCVTRLGIEHHGVTAHDELAPYRFNNDRRSLKSEFCGITSLQFVDRYDQFPSGSRYSFGALRDR